MKKAKTTDNELAQIEEKLRQEKPKSKMKVSGKSVLKLADIIKKGAYERHETDEKSRKNP